MSYEEKFMKKAMVLAKKAYEADEVPVGAVIVKDGKVLASAFNKRESSFDATAHAEILAIRKACKKVKDFRLIDAEIYVTLEPCLMCTGAIIQTRISKVVYGCNDPKGGAIDTVLNIKEIKNLNHSFESISKILEKECSMILKSYFKSKRN